MTAAPAVRRSVGYGLAWSLASTLILRLGSLVLGIVLARLLTPEAFGIYAVGLTVQTILMTLSDLGLSADLIRSRNFESRAPTVATLSLASGILLAGLMSSLAIPLASSLGSPDAAPIIVMLSMTLILSGLGVVPYSQLQRQIEQQKLFGASAVDFGVGTALTIGLVLAGMGPMALAIGRIAAQAAATGMQFVLSHLKPRFGFDRQIARTSLKFGLPLAGANLLSWVLLNIDNIVIARSAGEIALGLYVLAFNVSSWPMSAIGTAIRSVSLAAFSRQNREREAADGPRDDSPLPVAAAMAWAAAVPAGALLAVLSLPLVLLLYGDQWTASAGVLAALGLFGALRVLFDLLATYLMAHGAARPVFWIQVLWIVALTPVLVLATHRYGVQGAGWAHVVIAVVVILPAYLVALSGVMVRPLSVVKVLWPPVLAGALAWIAADLVASQFSVPLLMLLFGGLAGTLAYVAVLFRWLRSVMAMVRLMRASGNPDPLVVPPTDEGSGKL